MFKFISTNHDWQWNTNSCHTISFRQSHSQLDYLLSWNVLHSLHKCLCAIVAHFGVQLQEIQFSNSISVPLCILECTSSHTLFILFQGYNCCKWTFTVSILATILFSSVSSVFHVMFINLVLCTGMYLLLHCFTADYFLYKLFFIVVVHRWCSKQNPSMLQIQITTCK